MRGKHHVIVESELLKYEFDIRRNITVIQGDSATGKTTLVDLLNLHARLGKQSGVKVEADVNCIVYTGGMAQWEIILRAVENSIVFIDEEYSFVFRKEFALLVQETGNDYVIITRKPLKNLPYSIQEIYGIRTSGKYHFPEQVYHEFYQIYPQNRNGNVHKQMVLLLEDTNAGFQFYQKVCGEVVCLSAGGNSNIQKKLLDFPGEQDIVVIADGAAFGAYIEAVVKLSHVKNNLALYFPESFEWMVLKSGILNSVKIRDILDHPEDYIEGKEYMSWERYFTDLLIKETADHSFQKYSKAQLPAYYKKRA